jgi:methionine salvage enolase-phosphatase E1
MTVSFKQIKGVVLDIEGTTCPVDFVSGQLFPYARRALPARSNSKSTPSR